MIYAISDLHGCYDKYSKMLKNIQLNDTDTLYILGDVVDRGDGGIQILLDMMERPYVVGLLGNHDYMAKRMFQMFLMKDDNEQLAEGYRYWMEMGGGPTMDAFMELTEEKQSKVLSYIRKFPLYKDIAVNGQRFWLSHSVPSKGRMISGGTLREYEYFTDIPEYDKVYYEDTYIVTGHVPTGLIDEKYTGRIWRKNNHIAIDCGAIFGECLGCICLNDFKEYYI